jgi:hypothetical protein
MESVETMSESLWRVTREKMFERVKHAMRVVQREEQAKSVRWKPSQGAEYWYINDTGAVDNNRWEGDRFDVGRWDTGNVFRTKQEAEHAREKIKELLIKLHNEL